MTDMLVIICVVLIFYGLQFKKNRIIEDVLSIEQTTVLRGIASVVIVLHHLHNKVYDGFVFQYFGYIGFILCGVFFFLSGYGLGISEKEECSAQFLIRRISKILIPYGLVFLVYLIYKVKLLCEYHSYKDILSNYRNGILVVDNAWYVVTQIIMYIFFYVANKGHKSRKFYLVKICFMTICYVLICKYFLHYGLWWYNSCCCFPMGVFFAKNKKTMVEKMSKRATIIGLSVVWMGIMGLTLTKLAGNQTLIKVISDQLACILFCLIIVYICIYFDFGNMIIRFMGKISYEIYLFHGLYISLFREYLEVNSEIIYVILVFGCSIVSAVLANWITRKPIYRIKKQLTN